MSPKRTDQTAGGQVAASGTAAALPIYPKDREAFRRVIRWTRIVREEAERALGPRVRTIR